MQPRAGPAAAVRVVGDNNNNIVVENGGTEAVVLHTGGSTGSGGGRFGIAVCSAAAGRAVLRRPSPLLSRVVVESAARISARRR